MNNPNPCMTCGACCAFSASLFTGQKLTMLAERFRSVALAGTPGENAYCSVYKNRPSTCREFAMSGENGIANEACNRARAKYELPEI